MFPHTLYIVFYKLLRYIDIEGINCLNFLYSKFTILQYPIVSYKLQSIRGNKLFKSFIFLLALLFQIEYLTISYKLPRYITIEGLNCLCLFIFKIQYHIVSYYLIISYKLSRYITIEEINCLCLVFCIQFPNYTRVERASLSPQRKIFSGIESPSLIEFLGPLLSAGLQLNFNFFLASKLILLEVLTF